MPKQDSSLREIERALTVLASREGQRNLYERLAAQANMDLAPPECWLLLRLGDHEDVAPDELADRLAVPESRLRAHLEEFRRESLATGSGNEPASLTPEGREIFDRLVAARRQGLSELLDGWSPEQHEELARMLGTLARELIRDDPEPARSAA